jgi:hypothetical protein
MLMAVGKCHLVVLAIAVHAVKTRQEIMDDCTPTYDEHAKRAEVHFACLES